MLTKMDKKYLKSQSKKRKQTDKLDIKELDKKLKKGFKESEKRQKYLLKNEKTPKDLLEPITGIVKKVTNENYNTSIQTGEWVCGQRAKYSNAGYANTLEIEIDSDTKVKYLSFNGYSTIRTGDEVQIYVVQGKKEKLPFHISNHSPFLTDLENAKFDVLVKGDLEEKMQAYKIETLQENKIVRTDIATDCPK